MRPQSSPPRARSGQIALLKSLRSRASPSIYQVCSLGVASEHHLRCQSCMLTCCRKTGQFQSFIFLACPTIWIEHLKLGAGSALACWWVVGLRVLTKILWKMLESVCRLVFGLSCLGVGLALPFCGLLIACCLGGIWLGFHWGSGSIPLINNYQFIV